MRVGAVPAIRSPCPTSRCAMSRRRWTVSRSSAGRLCIPVRNGRSARTPKAVRSGWRRNLSAVRSSSPALAPFVGAAAFPQLLCQDRGIHACSEIGPHRRVDAADQLSLEAAQRLASGLALAQLALDIGLRGRVIAALRDRNSMERRVQLPVAAAVEPVALAG